MNQLIRAFSGVREEIIMKNDHFARLQKTTELHMVMEAQETRRLITDFPDNPEAMTYFYDLFANEFSENRQPANGKAVIGTMCVQVPVELIQAVGAVPLRMCSGSYAHDQAGAEFMPAKSCPLVKATTGMLNVNRGLYGDALKTIVIPTSCDQKKKAAEHLQSMGYEITILEMPSAKESAQARFYWQEGVKQLALDLEKVTGTKISKAKLAEAIRTTANASELFRIFYELRKADPPVILGKDAFLVANAFFFDDTNNWQKALAALINELEQRKNSDFSATTRLAPRILYTGSPPIFPNLKVPILLEQAGAVIVADEVCSSSRLLYDAVAYDEGTLNDMTEALADRYLKPCTCPCLVNNYDRIRKLKDMSQSFKVDGIVYQALSGCLPYEMEQRQISAAMAELNVPVLYLETDYSPEDMGQLSTRVEAFVESLKARKRKK